jgi:hypothetical protein
MEVDLRTGKSIVPVHVGSRDEPAPAKPPSPWAGRVVGLLGVLFGVLITILLLGVMQRTLPGGWRPSEILAKLVADYETTLTLATVDAKQFELAQLEQERSVTAQQLEEAKAKHEAYVESVKGVLQQQQKITEGKVQIVNDAYKALFDRNKQLVTMQVKMTQDFMERRLQMAQANQAGGTTAIFGSDLLRAWGIMTERSDLEQKAEQIRRGTQESQMRALDEVFARNIPQIDPNAFQMVGVIDPAKIAAELDLKPIVLPPPPLMPIAAPRATRPATPSGSASKTVP